MISAGMGRPDRHANVDFAGFWAGAPGVGGVRVRAAPVGVTAVD
jgi:hypothetical protein